LQFSYVIPEYPTTPRYHHECVRLVSFEEFSAWTLAEKQQAYAQNANKKSENFCSKAVDLMISRERLLLCT